LSSVRAIEWILICGVDVKSEVDLVGPGAAVGTVPTDLEQATGLERLEILGKMQGVDIFDMKPLDASRKGTITHNYD
jgi:cytochrome c oxidase subunit 5b